MCHVYTHLARWLTLNITLTFVGCSSANGTITSVCVYTIGEMADF